MMTTRCPGYMGTVPIYLKHILIVGHIEAPAPQIDAHRDHELAATLGARARPGEGPARPARTRRDLFPDPNMHETAQDLGGILDGNVAGLVVNRPKRFRDGLMDDVRGRTRAQLPFARARVDRFLDDDGEM